MFIYGITHKNCLSESTESRNRPYVRNGEKECTEAGTILLKTSGAITHWKYCDFVLSHPLEALRGRRNQDHTLA